MRLAQSLVVTAILAGSISVSAALGPQQPGASGGSNPPAVDSPPQSGLLPDFEHRFKLFPSPNRPPVPAPRFLPATPQAAEPAGPDASRVCGMKVVHGDPALDPKMLRTPRRDGAVPLITTIEPAVCGRPDSVAPSPAPAQR